MKIPSSYESTRLLIRRYTVDDSEDVFDLYSKNLDILSESFPKTTKSMIDIDSTKSFLESEVKNWENQNRFFFGIWNKNKEPVGQLQIKSLNFEIPSAEIAYFVCRTKTRKGIATEFLEVALKSLIDELGFKRVFARILPTNLASIRLIENLGFEKEGVHRNEFMTGDGRILDVIYYSLIR